MHIPDSCDAWTRAMEAGTNSDRRILENVRMDPCVADRVAAEFFSRLAASGSPTDGQAAVKLAYGVTFGDVELFTCTGEEVPDNLFVTLFRLESVSGLRYRIPEALDALGLSDAELVADNVSEDDLRAVTDDYDGSVNLGNALQIVWVTDYDDVLSVIDSLESLSDVLGLPATTKTETCVVCMYRRSETGTTLHVPRVFDGIANSEFFPNTDCDADVGMTRPLTGLPADGMPEAVHRNCVVVPDRWELRTNK